MSRNGLFGGFSAAVSLTFDDGTANQLERAAPVLDEYGLRGTFYLHARNGLMENHASDWRAVAETGHEIGNHTRNHPCPNAIHGRRGGVEDMTIEEIESDILEAQDLLETLAPHQEDWTFAYPCGATYVGAGLNQVSYVPVVAKHFVAARAQGEYGFCNHPDTMDAAALLSQRVDRMSGYEMIGLVQAAIDAGQWSILCFHDISGIRISVEEDEFRRLLVFLAARKNEILIAPLVDVVRSISGDHNGH
jgi:peptidoglycan/xylan/chitin deacetylase (PgdA/CDA1 family)